MSFNPSQFRQFVINPALDHLATFALPRTQFAADLLMATAAVESRLGAYLHQLGAGPALGVFQIEPASLQDLLKRTNRAPAIEALRVPGRTVASQIVTDLLLAAVVCRLFYWAVPHPLPSLTSKANLWSYYKTFYNTTAGAATLASFSNALRLTDLKL
jgi:hypothetical protein